MGMYICQNLCNPGSKSLYVIISFKKEKAFRTRHRSLPGCLGSLGQQALFFCAIVNSDPSISIPGTPSPQEEKHILSSRCLCGVTGQVGQAERSLSQQPVDHPAALR